MSAPGDIVGDVAALVQGFKAAWDARFGDAGKDIVAAEDVAIVLADLGVPDAALAATLLALLARVVELKAAYAPGDVDGQYWFYKSGPQPGGR